MVDVKKIEEGCRLIVQGLGLGNDEHTKDTPRRMANAILELCKYHINPKEPKITTFEDPEYDELVVVKDIPFVSLCSHHLMVFQGRVDVAYLPNGRILGLSKIPRIVEYFARRPQIQEYLAKDIADFIMKKVNPKGVLVVCRGTHTCASCRGANKPHTFVTSVTRGVLRDDLSLKQEALRLMGIGGDMI